MLLPGIVGVALILLTVLVHAMGTSAGLRELMWRYGHRDGSFRAKRSFRIIVLAALALLTLHWIEILLWAAAYLLLVPGQPLTSFEQETYFSAVTYTSLGYGDITLSDPHWRLLSGVEALSGILLVGWSTAALYALVHRSWADYAASARH